MIASTPDWSGRVKAERQWVRLLCQNNRMGIVAPSVPVYRTMIFGRERGIGAICAKPECVHAVFGLSLPHLPLIAGLLKKIDDALKNQSRPGGRRAGGRRSADGEALHKAGSHQESVDALAKAMKLLGICASANIVKI
ncbi:MAG: hypothetical protein IPP88_02955 [Betaproteobacteria bacterium]|nr:hypothetical protein [Betaproteobacteria bacterium]